MSWGTQLLLTIVVLAVVAGVVVVVAGGRGAPMAEEYDDRPDVRVPADHDLTGDDLRRVRFTTALRGYRAAEVDALLARLAAELDERRLLAPPDRAADRAPRPPADPAASPDADRPGAEHGRPDWSPPAARGDGE